MSQCGPCGRMKPRWLRLLTGAAAQIASFSSIHTLPEKPHCLGRAAVILQGTEHGVAIDAGTGRIGIAEVPAAIGDGAGAVSTRRAVGDDCVLVSACCRHVDATSALSEHYCRKRCCCLGSACRRRFSMPPPKEALLPEKVLLLTVSVLRLKMPPPSRRRYCRRRCCCSRSSCRSRCRCRRRCSRRYCRRRCCCSQSGCREL